MGGFIHRNLMNSSESEMGYEGISYNINTDEGGLFGTEGRTKGGPLVSDGDEIKSSPPAQTSRPISIDPLTKLREEIRKIHELHLSESTDKQHVQEEVGVGKNELAAISRKTFQNLLLELSASKQREAEKREAEKAKKLEDLDNLRLELTKSNNRVKELIEDLVIFQTNKCHFIKDLVHARMKLRQLKTIQEDLIAEKAKSEKTYESLALELKELRIEVKCENKLRLLESKNMEVDDLKSALELAEKWLQEEDSGSISLIESSNKEIELAKDEMGTQLENAKVEQGILKSRLDWNKGSQLNILQKENEMLRRKIEKEKEGKLERNGKGSSTRGVKWSLWQCGKEKEKEDKLERNGKGSSTCWVKWGMKFAVLKRSNST